MNEAEKRAFEMLSEEEQQEVLGGSKETDAPLTDEQCANLREAWIKTKAQESPFAKLTPEKLPAIMMYGGKPGIPAKQLYNLINDNNSSHNTNEG